MARAETSISSLQTGGVVLEAIVEQRRRGASAASAIIIIMVGLVGLYTASHRPEFQAMRSVDIVQLLGSGMCFGVGLVLLMFTFKGPQQP